MYIYRYVDTVYLYCRYSISTYMSIQNIYICRYSVSIYMSIRMLVSTNQNNSQMITVMKFIAGLNHSEASRRWGFNVSNADIYRTEN